jgi:hypothetical protein
MIAALDPADPRTFEVWVAGPAALLVAKTIKISERTRTTGRAIDKDALDVLRLLRAVPTADLEAGMDRLLNNELSSATTREAIETVVALFASAKSEGTIMAVRAATPLEDPDVVAASMVALTSDLLGRLRR